jgi:hypothetical protein
MPLRSMVMALLALALSGCGAASFTVHDLKMSPSGNTLYVLARNTSVSRNFCATLGGDVTRAEGRLASADTRTMRIGRVMGCYTVRHIIVCSEDDADCLTHEERHRDHGNFHR